MISLDMDDDIEYVGTTRVTRSKTSRKHGRHQNTKPMETYDDIEYVGTGRVTRSKTAGKHIRLQNTKPIETYTIEDEEDIVNEKKKLTIDGWLDITLQDDSDEDEPLEEVKAIWFNDTSKIERFTIKRTDPLLPIFEHFAKVNNVDIDKIVIHTNSYKQIHNYDSIETLDFKVTNFFIVSMKSSSEKEQQSGRYPTGDNFVEVKCQFKDKKQPILCSIHRNQPFSFVAEQCASKIGCNVKEIKLIFDGDTVSFQDTPSSLEFEGGECIDVCIAQ